MNEGIYVYENSWFSEYKFFPHLQQIIWNQDKGSLYWLLINVKM